MGEVREVFDVNQHPRKYGEITDLERRITAIKKRFEASCITVGRQPLTYVEN